MLTRNCPEGDPFTYNSSYHILHHQLGEARILPPEKMIMCLGQGHTDICKNTYNSQDANKLYRHMQIAQTCWYQCSRHKGLRGLENAILFCRDNRLAKPLCRYLCALQTGLSGGKQVVLAGLTPPRCGGSLPLESIPSTFPV